MADIELVIKLSEDSYKATCNGYMLPPDVENVVQGIKNATPLPKGHGRIGDLDLAFEAIEAYQDSIRSVGEFDAEKASALTLLARCKELINEVDAVIEADRVRDCQNK